MNPDDRLRAIRAAVAERERLIPQRAELAAQIAQQEQLVQQLSATLAREQHELDRLLKGVGNFLEQLLGGRATQQEQGVQEAAVHVQKEHARLVELRAQLANVDARLRQLASAPADLVEARAAKEQQLGPRTTAALQELDIQVMAIDIELAPLQQAIDAGTAALAAVVDLSNGLDEITALEESRKIVKATRARAGETAERLRAFEDRLGELATGPLELPRGVPGDTELEAWAEALFDRGDLAARIAAARAELSARIDRLRARISLIEQRHRELSARRSAVFGQRDELIDNADDHAL